MNWLKKHWEVLSYLIFGVLTTVLNIMLYALFNAVFGYAAANSWANVLDNIICILFAYVTNRAFVFRSKTTGGAMLKEFCAFVACRLSTLVIDTLIMMVGGNLLAAQGTALLSGIFGAMGSVGLFGISVASGVLEVGSILTMPVVDVWGMCVKIFSNVIVVVLNYVFSKLIIFNKSSNKPKH